MTRRELNVAIFEGTADQVLWQPRIETWTNHHRAHGTLPARFRGMENRQIYDALRCSIRYGPYNPIEHIADSEGIEHTSETRGGYRIATTRTPVGELRTVHQQVVTNGAVTNERIAEFPVKTPEQLRVATDLVERQRFRANLNKWEELSAWFGERGEPNLFLTSSGFTDLIKWQCGLIHTYYLLTDHPAEVEAHLEACDRRDDRLLDEALRLPARIFNLGDHATNEFTPPPILKRYLLPRWQKISARAHAAGKFVHTHWDGNSRHMLPYLQETGLDGVEALPAEPMGDMTLEQIKQAVGDRVVCLDLIPAIHFLSHYSMQDCLDFTRRVVDMFAPRLILGVSDEISQVGDIARIEAVGELVDRICGLAS